ncbi:unnamed protein product [Ectocarpus sp. 8 AP-2014]
MPIRCTGMLERSLRLHVSRDVLALHDLGILAFKFGGVSALHYTHHLHLRGGNAEPVPCEPNTPTRVTVETSLARGTFVLARGKTRRVVETARIVASLRPCASTT